MDELQKLKAFSKELSSVLELTEEKAYLYQENKLLKEKISVLQNENHKLKHAYRHGMMISKLLSLQGWKICPDCGGEGGFSNSEAGEMCQTCGGTGFVED